MRSALLLVAILASTAAAEDVYITVGSDAVDTVYGVSAKAEIFLDFESMHRGEPNGVSAVMKIDDDYVDALSNEMHEKFGRCGGFMVHDTLEEAFELPTPERTDIEYTLDRAQVVKAVLPALSAKRIEDQIREMSSMKNRYYMSASGARASVWLAELWRSLTPRTDVTIEFVDHGYEQKSVVMTIPGTTRPSEVVVIGGHLDSIAPGGISSNAPGADDDASGVSTLTEIARVLLAKDYRPERTIKFMAYAAEEVGLRGSLSIARDYKKAKINVVGALQLDMTNYQGSKKDIWLISDYTSAKQNAFVVSLIETYTGATWGWDQCGYACSDHASWHRAGVPASMPFEAKFREMNQSIHTGKDTLERSKNTADHAVKFARLGASYAIEMAKGDVKHATLSTTISSPSDGGCGAPWKLWAALASVLLGIALWLRTSRVG